MNFFMSAFMMLLSKYFFTIFALVRFFSSMHSFMSVFIIALSKSFLTILTLVMFFSYVNFCMFWSGILIWKLFFLQYWHLCPALVIFLVLSSLNWLSEAYALELKLKTWLWSCVFPVSLLLLLWLISCWIFKLGADADRSFSEHLNSDFLSLSFAIKLLRLRSRNFVSFASIFLAILLHWIHLSRISL